MISTSLTVKQIQYCLRYCGIWNPRADLMVPNVSWGLLDYEADFIIMTPNGYLTEIEIKRSFEDFKADFKKGHHHDDERIYHFYYCVPESIKDKVIEFLDENFKYTNNKPALLTYDNLGGIRKVNYGYTGAYRNKKVRKLFLEEQFKLARLAAFRYWADEEKTTGVELKALWEAHEQEELANKREEAERRAKEKVADLAAQEVLKITNPDEERLVKSVMNDLGFKPDDDDVF